MKLLWLRMREVWVREERWARGNAVHKSWRSRTSVQLSGSAGIFYIARVTRILALSLKLLDCLH